MACQWCQKGRGVQVVPAVLAVPMVPSLELSGFVRVKGHVLAWRAALALTSSFTLFAPCWMSTPTGLI